MYHYQIVWSWYEDYEHYELVHEKLFSQEEFSSLVKSCLRRAAKELLASEEKKEDYIGFDNVTERAIEILKRDHGFERVKYLAKHEVCGSPIAGLYAHERKHELEHLDEETLNDLKKHNERIAKAHKLSF